MLFVHRGCEGLGSYQREPSKQGFLLGLVDVKYTERREESVHLEKGWGTGAGC